jgi:ketosteroid isomerase-like protein
MSEENVEVIRRAVETYGNDIEAWLDLLDPALRWFPSEEGHSLVLGREDARRSHDRWMETFDPESYRAEAEEVRAVGENVFAVVHVWGRGRGSGIGIDDRTYIHFKVRNGKIVYCYEYEARDDALKAAGLSE